MMSEIFLGDNGAYSNSVYSNGSYSDCAYSNGVCRVHGGGFAGTILAIVKDNAVDEYRRNMDKIFGDGASMILQIRHCGGVRII
jgi:galactokinase